MSLVLPAAASYDGTDLNTSESGLPRLITRVVRGLDEPWEVRGEDTVIPGSRGRIRRDRVEDALTIELEVLIMGVGATEEEQRADVRAALDDLRALFTYDRDPATLVALMEDGTTRAIDAAPVNVAYGDDGTIPTRRVASVLLEAVGDDWEAVGS